MRLRRRGREESSRYSSGAPALTPDRLDDLRAAYRREAHVYRGGLSDDACSALDEIMEQAGFAGASDPPALGLLSFLIRTTRPLRVLQLGTLVGYSTILIGDILRTNGRGHLITVDPDPVAHDAARRSITTAGLDEWVTFVDGYSTDGAVGEVIRAAAPFDLVYLDASHSYRVTLEELDLILGQPGWIGDGGLLIAHDAAEAAAAYDPTGEGGVRRALDEWTTTAHAGVADRLILEPPLWPGGPGIALLRRRRIAATGRPR